LTSEHCSERVIQGESRPEWGRSRVAAVALLSFLLAAIVGLTSADAPWLSGGGDRSPAPPIVGEVLALAVAASLCALVGIAWVQAPGRSRRSGKARSGLEPDTDELGASMRTGALVLIGGPIAILCLIAAFWLLLDRAGPGAEPRPAGTPAVGDTVAVLPPAGPASSVSPTFHWFVLGLIASALIVLPIGVLARRRRRVAEAEPDTDAAQELVVRAVGDSIGQIERDPDARRAIIRAYARMEGSFDGAGIPRRPYEAPFEYLARALRGLRVSPAAARSLAALFEQARFGRHAVGPETKREALGALREIERQMREPPE
jgi:hypothetical protein